MIETNELTKLLNEIGEINEKIFPAHIFIGIIAVVLALWCYLRPNKGSTRLINGFLAIYYGIIVFTCVMCALEMQDIYYYLTVLVHTGITLLFVFSFTKDNIIFGAPEHTGIKFLSIFMTVYGIFLYPLVEILLGYTWPKIFILSFCPMGIFAIGIVITAYSGLSESKSLQILLLLLSLGAIIFGTRTVLIGGVFDLSYLMSGVIGIIVLLRYGQITIFSKNKD